MSVTEQQARALAFLATHARPKGAPQWQETDVMAALRRVAHLDLHMVAMACLRAAGDPTCHTPSPIGNPASLAWVERLAAPAETRRPTPPKAGEACWTCGRRMSTDPACCDRPELRGQTRPGDAETQAARLRALLVSTRGHAIDAPATQAGE